MLTPPVYDLANDILNSVRVRLNDRIDTLVATGGKLLDSTQPWTQQAFNNAYRKLQEYLAAQGFARFTTETILQSFPALPNIDPAIQCWINWVQNFDGVNLTTAPVLPANFIQPMVLWQRASGSTDAFTEMDRQIQGIPAVPKNDFMLMWEWREDKIYLDGARIPCDLRIRFAAYLPDIVNDDANFTPWFEQRVPIMRCMDAMTDYICREIYIARGDAEAAAAFQQSAEANAEQIFNRDKIPHETPAKDSERGKMADKRTA